MLQSLEMSAKIATSWHSLPFELKSLILKHYVRDLLQTTARNDMGMNAPSPRSGIHVKGQIFLFMLATAEMRAEIVKVAEEVKEEVVELLMVEYDYSRTKALSWLFKPVASPSNLLRAIYKSKLHSVVQHLVGKIQEVVDAWTES